MRTISAVRKKIVVYFTKQQQQHQNEIKEQKKI